MKFIKKQQQKNSRKLFLVEEQKRNKTIEINENETINQLIMKPEKVLESFLQEFLNFLAFVIQMNSM